MDPITLSAGLASLLTPYLSYLLDSAGKRLSSKIVSVTGDRNTIQYGKYNTNIGNMQGGHIGDRYG